MTPVGNEAAVTAFMSANHRNMETGIALLLLALFSWWASRPECRPRLADAGLWLVAAVWGR